MHKPLLVTDFLDRARSYYGDEEAVAATTGERYTYDELGDRADRLSAALEARGIEKGDRVAVLDRTPTTTSKPPTASCSWGRFTPR